MRINNQHYKTVWIEGSEVVMIDQNLLPFKLELLKCPSYRDTAKAIKDMNTRGAGAIGATAGYAMAQAFVEGQKISNDWITMAKQEIEATRPTAQNLFYATNRVFNAAVLSETPVETALAEAVAIALEDELSCKAIGEHGADLIQDGMNIETHCNAGWLAFVDYGSALSPLYEAHRKGKSFHVWVDETRPRSQGARLTAWELFHEGIDHKIIPDNAGAHLMQQGKVDLMIVGADRIAANGDAANKIGTLEKAIAAKYYGVPFYAAAPLSTFDMNCESGKQIPIENRSEDELLYQEGPDENGDWKKVRVSSPHSSGINPGFDVTTNELITGIITPKGIVKPNVESIKKLFV